MTHLEIVALAFALAADAFTIGAVVGLNHRSPRQLFRLSYHFGLFQSLLSLLGALIGSLLLKFVAEWDHWIVFGILLFLGLRMISSALNPGEKESEGIDLTRGIPLVGLSLAVSIDALAAGVGLPAAGANIWWAVWIIGLIASAATLVAMVLAAQIQKIGGRWIEAGAGLVLIALGANTFFSHLAAL